MIDKEMAEEYAIENRESCMYNDTKGWETDHEAIKKAFLAGLEAGKDMAEADLATIAYMQGAEQYKLKWHYVKDGDLPKNTRYVWTNVGPSYYDDDRDCPCWRDEFGRTQGVIAWCEPKFEE